MCVFPGIYVPRPLVSAKKSEQDLKQRAWLKICIDKKVQKALGNIQGNIPKADPAVSEVRIEVTHLAVGQLVQLLKPFYHC